MLIERVLHNLKGLPASIKNMYLEIWAPAYPNKLRLQKAGGHHGLWQSSFSRANGLPKLQEEAPPKPQKWLHGLDLDPKVQKCCDNVTWPLLANARPCLQMQMLLLQTHGHRKRCPKQQLGQAGSKCWKFLHRTFSWTNDWLLRLYKEHSLGWKS